MEINTFFSLVARTYRILNFRFKARLLFISPINEERSPAADSTEEKAKSTLSTPIGKRQLVLDTTVTSRWRHNYLLEKWKTKYVEIIFLHGSKHTSSTTPTGQNRESCKHQSNKTIDSSYRSCTKKKKKKKYMRRHLRLHCIIEGCVQHTGVISPIVLDSALYSISYSRALHFREKRLVFN